MPVAVVGDGDTDAAVWIGDGLGRDGETGRAATT